MQQLYQAAGRSIFCLLCSCSLSIAATPTEGWYAGGMLGINAAPAITLPIIHPLTKVITNSNLSYGWGANGGAQLGYRFECFRLEGELNFNLNPFDKLDISGLHIKKTPKKKRNSKVAVVPGLTITGQTGFVSTILNAYYDLDTEDYNTNFVPYVGVGLGYAYVQNTLNVLNAKLLSSTIQSKGSTGIGQIILGSSYFFDNDIALALDYRYLGTSKITATHSNAKVQTLNLSMNFAFDCSSDSC